MLIKGTWTQVKSDLNSLGLNIYSRNVKVIYSSSNAAKVVVYELI